LDGGVDVVIPASLAGHLQIHMNNCGTFPHALSVLANGAGTAVATPFRTRYATGMTVTLTAPPGPRQRFDHWSGSVSSTLNPLELAMTQTSTITAHFVPDMKSIGVSTEGLGTVGFDPPGTSQLVGTAITAFADPAPGYAFEGWTGDVVSDSVLIHFQLDRPMSLIAHFQPDATTGVTPGTPRFSLAPPRPNPVQGDARVHFTLSTTGRATLDVLDAGGRVVRHLLDADLPAGPHESRWDGHADSGGRLAPGLYWLRLSTSAGQLTQRFASLR
ncbi:MAG: hypothetical protein K8R56_10170, partial [Candidatus Eisenbacteria bacterium]|nr:hypothetical protein [Candidatus Eisenbacteria bacterium]